MPYGVSLRFVWPDTWGREEFLGGAVQRRNLRGSARRSRGAERRAGRALIDVARSRAAGRDVSAQTDTNCGNDSPRQKPITRRHHTSAPRKTIPTQHARRHGAGRTAVRLRSARQEGPPLPSSSLHRRRRKRGRCRPMLRMCALEAGRGYQPSCAKEEKSASTPNNTVQKTRKFFARSPCALLDFQGHRDG
jgi:hypothetical protein